MLIVQTWRDGIAGMMEPPGSYCAYACLYITMCLIKIFTIATNTFEEQFRHIAGKSTLPHYRIDTQPYINYNHRARLFVSPCVTTLATCKTSSMMIGRHDTTTPPLPLPLRLPLSHIRLTSPLSTSSLRLLPPFMPVA